MTADLAILDEFDDVRSQPTYRNGFRQLWNSLHNDKGKTWDDNPQAVAFTFKVHRGNVDELTQKMENI